MVLYFIVKFYSAVLENLLLLFGLRAVVECSDIYYGPTTYYIDCGTTCNQSAIEIRLIKTHCWRTPKSVAICLQFKEQPHQMIGAFNCVIYVSVMSPCRITHSIKLWNLI